MSVQGSMSESHHFLGVLRVRTLSLDLQYHCTISLYNPFSEKQKIGQQWSKHWQPLNCLCRKSLVYLKSIDIHIQYCAHCTITQADGYQPCRVPSLANLVFFASADGSTVASLYNHLTRCPRSRLPRSCQQMTQWSCDLDTDCLQSGLAWRLGSIRLSVLQLARKWAAT